jgi:hypothetical protein
MAARCLQQQQKGGSYGRLGDSPCLYISAIVQLSWPRQLAGGPVSVGEVCGCSKLGL